MKDNNAKYVFVRDGKVYNVDNQGFAGLQEHAGHTVALTGEMRGDTSLTTTYSADGDWIVIKNEGSPPTKYGLKKCEALESE